MLVLLLLFQMLDVLLTTLIGELQGEGNHLHTRALVRRFVRSVCRIFVILSIEINPSNYRKRYIPKDEPKKTKSGKQRSERVVKKLDV